MNTGDTNTVELFNQKLWSQQLLEIPKPPKQLFIKGAFPPIGVHTKFLTIVGTREITEYGKSVIDEIIPQLLGYPIIIVSGLAYGVDSYVHNKALEYGLKCIAFPGSGLDQSVLYPKRNLQLAEKIIESGGCLLSELEPRTAAASWIFPARNRLLAAISDATLVIEAKKKSGSLMTARHALSFNKSVWAVPGPITNIQSSGTNWLLQEGAFPILSGEDILKEFQFDVQPDGNPQQDSLFTKPKMHINEDQYMVLQILVQPKQKSELLRMLDLPIGKANMLLSMMEIKKMIKEEFGVVKRLVRPDF